MNDDGDGLMAAATFQAFGMFGRRTAPVTLQASPIATNVVSVELSSVPTPDARNAPVAVSSASISVGSPHRSSGTWQGEAARRPPARSPILVFADAGVADTPSDVVVMVPDEDVSAPATVRHRPGARPAGQEATRLILSDSLHAAGLVVRLAGLSQDEVVQFRARARTLLGEYGLHLDKLDVNGEDQLPRDPPRNGIHQWR